MKRIYLAKKGKRILARFIDVLITFIITLVIFVYIILPNAMNKEKVEENSAQIISLYHESGLFVVDENGDYNANSAFQNVTKLDDLYNITCNYQGKDYENISLTKSLYEFYTMKFTKFGNTYNLTLEIYKSSVLKVGTAESNIKDYDEVNNKLILIDDSKEDVTVHFFLEAYSKTCMNVINDSTITDLTNQNQKLILGPLWYLIPLLGAVTFILEFLIPLFSPCGETIGKHLMKLGVLTEDGYRLKKIRLLPRWLAYYILEFTLGIMSFGATVLITYTMFLFCKKRRCLHDKIAKTVVIEKAGSIYFASKEEEAFYINRQQRMEAGLDA